MPARKVLCGQLDVLPDNKCVEDLHLEPKLDSKSKANRKMRAARIQDKVLFSNALGSRGIEDRAKISKEVFVTEYEYASKQYSAGRHNPSKHLVKKSWSKILGKKTWHTVSEEVLRRNSAAFAWLEEVAGMATPPARFDNALFSALCPPLSLISRCDDTAPLRALSDFWVLPTPSLPK